MTTYISETLTWTDDEERAVANEVLEMVNSPKSRVMKQKDGSCDVYHVNVGNEEKATIVNRKMEEDSQGSWIIYSGKFKQQGIGPFVDDSDFNKGLSNGKGIRNTLVSKIAAQQVLNNAYNRTR